MPAEGLYLLEDTNNTDVVLTWDFRGGGGSSMTALGLAVGDISSAVFYISKPDGYTTYQIKNLSQDKYLEYAHSNIQLGSQDGQETRYRWHFQHSPLGPDIYNIVNSNDVSYSLSLQLGAPPTLIGPPVWANGPWKLHKIPDAGDKDQDDDDNNDDDSDTADGKTADEWRKIAKEMYDEGLKMMNFASESTWLNNTDSYRQSYVDLWEKLGQKHDLDS
ncbi:hypothetical protein F5Y03DRAFT_352672 [Xylaria venustula]|nr:hypothetical protein F5Y03DRAFT_352672 [Xylaria venustula]